MPGFGIVLSSPASADLDALNYRQLALFVGAREALLADPTTANLFVVALDGIEDFGPGEFGLLWGDVVVLFRFASPSVLEVFAVLAR